MTRDWTERETDVLVIGTGLAGLRAAIEARRSGQRVLLVDKSLIGINNNTALAGGGIKGALPGVLDTSVEKQYDTPEEHFRDTVEYGEFLCDQSLVETMAFEAPERILELREFDIPHFEALCTYGQRQPIALADGSVRVEANPARGGQAITKALAAVCEGLGVKTITGCVLLDLLRGQEGVVGALLYRIFGGQTIVCRARSVILATGGCGELFRINYSSNVSTGDGYAVALRAGAELVGMEFTMFSPHTMMEPGLPMWYLLPCEARLHAVYRNGRGEPFLDTFLNRTGEKTPNFLKRYGELSSDIREVISRAIAIEIFEGRGDGDAIWLDFREVADDLWDADLPGQYNLKCLIRDFDLKERPIRISPGALTHLGGIGVDVWGYTGVPGLYASGEVTAPVHGARRRGGNAFTDCVVFGARSGRAAAEYAKSGGPDMLSFDRDMVEHRMAEIARWRRAPTAAGDPTAIRQAMQATMWANAGPLRTSDRLEACLADLAQLRGERMPSVYANTPFEVKGVVELCYMLEIAEVVAKCALFRPESRGGHFRADCPGTDNVNWFCQSTYSQAGGDAPRKREVETTRYPPPHAAYRKEQRTSA